MIGGKPDQFDLTDDYDFDRLIRTLSVDNAVAGLYLADLRAQYHGRLQEPQEEAINEWWFEQFDNMLILLRTGDAPPKKRLH
ncbi:hypothetical protein HOU03_gp472 [Caulobacter phage CcrSC]|uniref:Uncharacterized protein n=1 Tax=Caulobacter phage CcrSC TaxID=2283272 RepID=A0A385EFJ5_9CAUD|nr:hypothetical protein HOU03_gp472 [Caulobacter phage CcrSC]AXQ69795.1 hypothetical protein CcrSC_gp213 [Caulobacter phage CcrSC]